jgi:hypothetical protein
MRGTPALKIGLAAVICAFGAAASLVGYAGAASSGPAAAKSRVAGTLDTRVVITRFTANGVRIVGHGVAKSTLRNAAGAVISTSQKPFSAALRAATGPGPCKVLYLELDELGLTLLGLRAHLYSATPGEPIELTLSADSTHGVLGQLFCTLANATITLPSASTAAAATKSLNTKLHSTTVLRAQATLYAPAHNDAMVGSQAAANCPVLHLILGPLHLDLLGLIVDLNKIGLDVEGIPGTTIGDLFCSLSPAPTTTAPATTAATTTAGTTT